MMIGQLYDKLIDEYKILRYNHRTYDAYAVTERMS